jgi:hypothetical protein
VVDGPPPPHLRIGHAATDSWTSIRQRFIADSMLRGIRIYGPTSLAARYGSGKVSCDGYCSTCYKLSDDPAIAAGLEPVMASPGMRVVEEQLTIMQQAAFVRRYGVGRYAQLAALGEPCRSE